MGRFDALQNSFVNGEISPRLNRGDLAAVKNGLEELENGITLPLGPVQKRPGTSYSGAIKDQSVTARLHKFVSSLNSKYVLEIGDEFLRIHDDNGVVLSGAAFTNGAFTTDLTGWTNTSTGTGSAAQSSGVCNLSGGASGVGAITQTLTYFGIEQYTITATVTTGEVTVYVGTTSGGSEVASGTISVGAGQTFSFTPTTNYDALYITFRNANGDTRSIDDVTISTPAYTLPTPYTQAEINDLWFAQSADVLYVFHGSHRLRTFGHLASNRWLISEVEYVDGPYLAQNIKPTHKLDYSTGTTTEGSTGVVINATGAGFTPFTSSDVGRLVRMQNTTTKAWGWMTITAVNSSTQIEVTLGSDLPVTAPTANWRFGAFSDTLGHPSIGVFQEGRLVMGVRESESVINVYGTEIQGYTRTEAIFSPSSLVDGVVSDANAFTAPIAANGADPILWMSPGPTLAIGTREAEWTLSAGDRTRAMSPTNLLAVRHTERGSTENVLPVRIAGSVFFVDRTGRSLREFVFVFQKDAFDAEEVSLLADHILREGVQQLVYAQAPHSLVWAALEDGTLASFTFVGSQQVSGWARHSLGGGGVVESMTVIPSEDSRYDELVLLVRRTIDGNTVRYIERMKEPFYLSELEDHVGLDCSKLYDGAATDTVTGLEHLEGETVAVFADGAKLSEVVVTGGEITLPREYSKVLVGYSYTMSLQTKQRHWEDATAKANPDGSTVGKHQRLPGLLVEIFESTEFEASTDGSTWDKYNVRTTASGVSQPPTIYSGIVDVPLLGRYNRDARVWIRHTEPGPFTLVQVAPRGIMNG